jgi:hypothetical protein
MAQSARLGGCLVLGALLSAACGDGDDLNRNARLAGTFPPVDIGPAQVTPSRVGDEDVGDEVVSPPDSRGDDPTPGGDDEDDDDPAPVPDPDVCVTPDGVSGSPRTLSQALRLMNSLPKPTSLPCFLQALSRPLEVYMTRSDDSLQPSPGARSPRTFIVFEPLVMSIVFEGDAHIALELGYRTETRRSIKTEIAFPLRTDVTSANLFDRVLQGGEATRCGNCHTGEVQTLNADLPVTVFESDILEPFAFEEVDIASMRGERESCDPSLEPARCALLSAFFDFGTVEPAPGGIMF